MKSYDAQPKCNCRLKTPIFAFRRAVCPTVFSLHNGLQQNIIRPALMPGNVLKYKFYNVPKMLSSCVNWFSPFANEQSVPYPEMKGNWVLT